MIIIVFNNYYYWSILIIKIDQFIPTVTGGLEVIKKEDQNLLTFIVNWHDNLFQW